MPEWLQNSLWWKEPRLIIFGVNIPIYCVALLTHSYFSVHVLGFVAADSYKTRLTPITDLKNAIVAIYMYASFLNQQYYGSKFFWGYVSASLQPIEM